MKPLVIHVVEAFGGGVFESMRQLSLGTHSSHRILIVHSLRDQTPANFREMFPSEVEFIALPMARAVSPKKDAAHIVALRKLFKQHRPAYIHAHSSKAGALARIASLGLGIPTGYSPRGYSFLMKDQSAKKRFIYYAIERLLGLLPATTIACGYDEFEIAKKTSRKAAVIPNSIRVADIPEDKRTRPPVTDNLVVIGSGRISPQKNFPLFCEVADAFAGQPISFIWIGGGETDISSPNVHVTGWLPQAEAHKVLNTGHVYLHLSGWEGLSRAILEAMAYGFPLVVSDVVGNRELTAANNGYICRTKPEVIGALQNLLDDPKLVATMGQASLAHLKNRYEWERSLQSWKELYSGRHA